jgi:tetratricopeptide (TPR) repeat protein
VNGRWLQLAALVVVAALFVVAALVAAIPASASDDAGVRSVFARGAGNRALALGGAYAAVADDASAVVWNPAGLGLIRRANVYATHTDLIGMGFSEQLGSLVVPHWRLGTVALTYRRFGVDGIERRDERNVLLDDALTDSELEVALGYGLALGDAWNVGGAFKLQRQQLAEYRDSALGLDLGVLVRPLLAAGVDSRLAHELQLGIGFRNVVEPTLRLDEDPVRDPGTVRAGIALQRAVGTYGDLLVTADLEKSRDMDTRLHAGLEWRMIDPLALRVGTNAGDLAAGAGVRWRDVTLDYTFEDNRLESVHRVGVGLAFGATTEESRRAAMAREEARLAAELVRVSDERNRRRVAELVASARTALQQDRIEDALTLAATVRVLAPARDDVVEIEATAYRTKARAAEEAGDLAGATILYRRCLDVDPDDDAARSALNRVRLEADQQASRTAELRETFSRALESYGEQDLLAARDGFAAVLRQLPDDVEAAAMLRHTEETIQLRAGSLADQARALAQAGELQRARDALAEARELAPDHPAVARAARALSNAAGREVAEASPRNTGTLPVPASDAAMPETVAAPATPVHEPTRLTAEREAELAELYRRGMLAAQAGRRYDALRYWELVWSAAPDFQNVAEHLEREYLARGMEFFATNDVENAVREWEKALTIDPDDPRARGYLERAYEQRARIDKIRNDSP